MPWAAIAHMNLAELLVGDPSKRDEAVKHLLTALDLNPSLARVHCDLGAIYLSDGDVGKAIEHLRKGTEMAPDLLPFRQQLAEALLMVGKRGEALNEFNQILEAQPGNVPALNGKARALATRSDPAIRHDRSSLDQ